MDAKIDLIFGEHHITRRSPLNIVGNLQHALFRVLDEEFAEKYANDMGIIMDNQNHLNLLLKNHTSAIDSTLNVVMKHDKELKFLNDRVNNVTKYISDHLSYTSYRFEVTAQFSLASVYLNQFASDYEQQIDAILEILTDSHKNHVNHYLFPPGQIFREVERISNFVKNKFLVPEGNDLYKILEITSFILKKQLVFKISFPLFRLEQFNIHKIIRVPSVHGNELWWINNLHDYMISATNHKIFQFMTELEFSQCLSYRSDAVVCKRPQQWLTSQIANHCAWNLFIQNEHNDCKMNHGPLETIFIELNQNKWIFIIPNITKVTAVCNHAAFHDELQGEGVLSLNQNCMLIIRDIQLDAHRDIEEPSGEILVPSFNHSALIKFHSNKLKLDNHDFVQSNFTELRNMMIDAKNFSINKLNQHAIHHSINYIFVIICIACIIYIYVKYQPIKIRAPIPAVRRISMPTLAGRENVAVSNESSNVYATAT